MWDQELAIIDTGSHVTITRVKRVRGHAGHSWSQPQWLGGEAKEDNIWYVRNILQDVKMCLTLDLSNSL